LLQIELEKYVGGNEIIKGRIKIAMLKAYRGNYLIKKLTKKFKKNIDNWRR
jgi:hypothetical protein